MRSAAAYLDELDEIYELNRLFLFYLAHKARFAGHGLDRKVAELLRTAATEHLDALAKLPRALFRLVLPESLERGVRDLLADAADPARLGLQLMIARCAWSMTRDRPHAACLFLGLSHPEQRRLRSLSLTDLLPLAATDGLVRSAFPASPWLWHRLLTENRPESRRQLLLIAMQPQASTRPATSLAQFRSASA